MCASKLLEEFDLTLCPVNQYLWAKVMANLSESYLISIINQINFLTDTDFFVLVVRSEIMRWGDLQWHRVHIEIHRNTRRLNLTEVHFLYI
jgi:hypothetical protein